MTRQIGSETQPAASNRWVVGLDLQTAGNGPVEFCKWLADNADKSNAPRFVGLHVLENGYLFPMLEYHHLEEVVSWAREAVLKDIDRAWASSAFAGLHVVQGKNATTSLLDGCAHQDAVGLVIGRHAPRAGRHIVRLGRVPRRILRQLTLPTVVVPPDFTGQSAGSGRVIAATSLSAESADAARFAQRVAQSLGRPLLLVHVMGTPAHYGARYIPQETLDILQRRYEAEGNAALKRWAARHELLDAELRVLTGSVVQQIEECCGAEDTCLLCVGAEYMPLWERATVGSFVSEIAATAPCPVAVVPPMAPELR